MTRIFRNPVSKLVWLLMAIIAVASFAHAQVAPAAAPVIGSGNTATADPPVPHPHSKPCVVPLFKDEQFDNFNPLIFSYTPPDKCAAPWAKVVFVGDFNVTEGIQFDRTASIYLGHVNIYFGTTPEPDPSLGPTWHVERDITDYSALLTQPQSGEADIFNLVNSTFTGIIFGTARLEFYAPDTLNPAPRTADSVLPMPNAAGGAMLLSSPTQTLAETFTLPTNVERAYLDVIAQSQQTDEQWFLCPPTSLETELDDFCGNTAFRETEITIDGAPAGVAPIYPWIYTGGIDPFLWAPIPGVQTLNFVPYRVDLTPFAGLLSNGQQHTVSLSVFNTEFFFSVDATLLLYQDHGSSQVTGEVTENTLSAEPSPTITNNLSVDSSGDVTGNLNVSSKRQYTLAGFVNTSHGKVSTKVFETVNFSNTQAYDITATLDVENVTQLTTVDSTTTTHDGAIVFEQVRHVAFPLTANISFVENPDGTFAQKTKIVQKYEINDTERANGVPIFLSILSNGVTATDDLLVNSSFEITGNQGQASSQDYFSFDTLHGCYSHSLAAANNVLTAITKGQGCNSVPKLGGQ
jgi:Peptide N-acetyl-beta-D-glucosaminyl asparaginase amidase A